MFSNMINCELDSYGNTRLSTTIIVTLLNWVNVLINTIHRVIVKLMIK